MFFSLSLSKRFLNFEKLIRFHWQAFIAYKNRENLKMLIEIFCQKLIVSNVILAFLGHLKPKSFFVGQPWRPTLSATPFQNLWIRPWIGTENENFSFISNLTGLDWSKDLRLILMFKESLLVLHDHQKQPSRGALKKRCTENMHLRTATSGPF